MCGAWDGCLQGDTSEKEAHLLDEKASDSVAHIVPFRQPGREHGVIRIIGYGVLDIGLLAVLPAELLVTLADDRKWFLLIAISAVIVRALIVRGGALLYDLSFWRRAHKRSLLQSNMG